jgi:hypothetical protein
MGVFVQLRVATAPNNMRNTSVGYLEGMLANPNPKPLCLYKPKCRQHQGKENTDY